MIHFPLLSSRRRTPPLPDAMQPLTPAAYLRLRRKAARLSVEQVAAKIAPSVTHRADAVMLIDMLETEGCKARRRETIDCMEAAFPIDPNVYFQLATAPAGEHPQVCRGCGCSHWDPCVASDDGLTSCHWAAPHICSTCSPEPIAAPEDVA